MTRGRRQPVTDTYFRQLLKELRKQYTRQVVHHLLQGNDNQCFTTQQYKAVYIARDNKRHRNCKPLTVERADYLYNGADGSDWGRAHLLDSDKLVREVAPDVWAENNDAI